ncbi:MAG: NHLP family bacteriocin export ABC transporter peptidase/permease/ATPase subunit [Betaproteobacteria bacterium]
MSAAVASTGNSRTAGTRRRVPTILQMEAVECGAASLAMVLAYHKLFVPLEELRLMCGVTRDGTKASNVLKAARSYGFTGKGFKKEPDELRTLRLPAIVFWNFNHFLVLEGFRGGRVYLNDPAAGPRVVTDDEFDQSFTGVVLTLEPGPDFKQGGRPPSVIAALKRRFVGLNAPVAYVILTGLALVVPSMLAPVFISIFIDKYLVSGLESWLKPLLIGMAITAVVRMALTWLEGYCLLRIQTRIAMATASKFFWHVLRLPVEFFTQRSAGEIGSRVAINDEVAGMLSGDLAQAALSVLTAMFFALLMLYYDVVLSLISIALVCMQFVFLRLVMRKMKEMSMKLAIESGKVLGTSTNGLLMMETLKANGWESTFFSKWAGFQTRLMRSEQEFGRVSVLLGGVPTLLFGLNNILVLGIGALRVMDGHLTIGALVAFQSLVASFTAPVSTLVGLGSRMQEIQGNMNRLDDVMDYPTDPWASNVPLLHEAKPEAAAESAKLEGEVSLGNIHFGYNRADVPLIEEFNLQVRPGERVAIVGPSGCGKSTVSKLVMGLYEAWQGEVLFDQKRRTDFSRYVFANSVCLVDQDIVLFEGTFRENLTLWDDTISEADMIQGARDACIHDFILSRPGGYDSMIDEGGRNMSGGQRQRIEIARALTANPRVLVLDEATSALDAATEKMVDDNIRRRGCTCIIIAHRLSTIRDCDEIIVLSRGRIVERGNHDALMAKESGFYSRLVSQL